MRRFLYYNQDSINSFLAQIEQGLLLRQEVVEEKSNSDSSTQEIHSDITGDISAKVLGIGASLQGNIKGVDSDTEIVAKMVKNIQEKALHDYAFEKVYEHINQNNLIKYEPLNIGDIVLTIEVPTFLDFAYFQGLFADNGAVRLANEQTKKEFEKRMAELKQNVPKGTQMSEVIKVQVKSMENKLKEAEPERKEMNKTIEAIRNTLPYSRFLMTDCFLVPLDDSNFRDDPNIVAFKYGGEVSIFGYVTNIIYKEEKSNRDNAFAPLFNILNSAMLNLFKEKDKVYIIHPIALYY